MHVKFPKILCPGNEIQFETLRDIDVPGDINLLITLCSVFHLLEKVRPFIFVLLSTRVYASLCGGAKKAFLKVSFKKGIFVVAEARIY